MKKTISIFGLVFGMGAFAASAQAATVIACAKGDSTVQVDSRADGRYDLTYSIDGTTEVIDGVTVLVANGGGTVGGEGRGALVLTSTQQAGTSTAEFVAGAVTVTGLVCSVSL